MLLVAFAMLNVGSGQASSTDHTEQSSSTSHAGGQTAMCPPQEVEVGRYVDLESNCVWYADHGKGTPLVLLHGGAVDSRWWESNLDALAEHFHVYTQDLRGHGRTPDVEGPFTFDALTQDTIELLEAVVDTPATLVGHSTGGTVALMVALRRPDLVDRLVLASSGFNREASVPGAEFTSESVDETVEFLGETYGEVSPDGEEHFRVVVEKLAGMAPPDLAASDLAAIQARTLVMVSDDDIVTLEHNVEMYRAIPNSELVVVPGTSHFLTQEKPELVNTILLDFLTNDPITPVAPIRRAQHPPIN